MATSEAMRDMQSWPRSIETSYYLDKHRILNLFNNLTSMVLFEQPEDPKRYLIEQLELLQKAQNSEEEKAPCLLDESNMDSMFTSLDPSGRGVIDIKKYREAFKTLGVEDYNQYPEGGDKNAIDRETFVQEAMKSLKALSSTYEL